MIWRMPRDHFVLDLGHASRAKPKERTSLLSEVAARDRLIQSVRVMYLEVVPAPHTDRFLSCTVLHRLAQTSLDQHRYLRFHPVLHTIPPFLLLSKASLTMFLSRCSRVPSAVSTFGGARFIQWTINLVSSTFLFIIFMWRGK